MYECEDETVRFCNQCDGQAAYISDFVFVSEIKHRFVGFSGSFSDSFFF